MSSQRADQRIPDPQRARSSEIVHLGTGELIELERAEPDTLAEAALLLRERERELAEMRKLLEAELGDRLARRPNPRKVWTLDNYEVKSINRSEWDVEELEGVLDALVRQGTLRPHDIDGVLRRELKLDGTRINRLAARLRGFAAGEAIEACRTWRQRGVEIARVIPLLPPQD